VEFYNNIHRFIAFLCWRVELETIFTYTCAEKEWNPGTNYCNPILYPMNLKYQMWDQWHSQNIGLGWAPVSPRPPSPPPSLPLIFTGAFWSIVCPLKAVLQSTCQY